mmetsp:Transcript_32172/g.83438  ORF Transcript_32172/g.83438 Transcript_32172/m.83438 type:complete len:323 (+) Transcript_32172:355-1323(+)
MRLKAMPVLLALPADRHRRCQCTPMMRSRYRRIAEALGPRHHGHHAKGKKHRGRQPGTVRTVSSLPWPTLSNARKVSGQCRQLLLWQEWATGAGILQSQSAEMTDWSPVQEWPTPKRLRPRTSRLPTAGSDRRPAQATLAALLETWGQLCAEARYPRCLLVSVLETMDMVSPASPPVFRFGPLGLVKMALRMRMTVCTGKTLRGKVFGIRQTNSTKLTGRRLAIILGNPWIRSSWKRTARVAAPPRVSWSTADGRRACNTTSLPELMSPPLDCACEVAVLLLWEHRKSMTWNSRRKSICTVISSASATMTRQNFAFTRGRRF